MIYKIAVSITPGVNADVVRQMESRGITPEEFITLPTQELRRRLELHDTIKFQQNERETALFRARQEMEIVNRHSRMHVLYLTDENYPMRLAEIPDAPVVLYCLGDCDLNAEHMLSMVGTRRCTPYGENFVKQTIADLAVYYPDMVVVSGLAYGIDSSAHVAALENNVKTVAVMAHGLHTIYPVQNTELARAIVNKGGAILSEYPSGTPAHKSHFLARNRIVAGLSPLTIVAESEVKGGAMSTASKAMHYDRQVMALPGRTCDTASSGCNSLIRRHIASLVERAADVVELMGWQPQGLHINTSQRNLFPELDGDTKKIYDCLRLESEPLSTDAIHYKTGLPVRRIMELLTDMEFDGILSKGAGNRYALV